MPPISVTITILLSGDPVGDAQVWLSTQADGTPVAFSGITTDAGEVAFLLDEGETYFAFARKSGVGDLVAEEFDADAAGHTFALTAVVAGALTMGEVVSRFRKMVSDESARRWKDPTVIEYINDGQTEAFQLRDDLLLKADGTRATPAYPTTQAGALTETLGGEAPRALAHYAAWLALNRDGADGENKAQAQDHLARFHQILAVAGR